MSAQVLVRVVTDPDRRDDAGDDADDQLAALVARFLRVPASQVVVGRRCPHCAGTDHGRPVVSPISGSRVHASIARTPGRTAVAAGSLGPLGVDVERVDPDRFAGVAAVVRHVDEAPAGSLAELATRWVRKEAVLKATGWGLAWDPSGLDVTSTGPAPFLVTVARDGQDVPVWVSDLAVGSEYAAAVAVVSRTPPRVLLLD